MFESLPRDIGVATELWGLKLRHDNTSTRRLIIAGGAMLGLAMIPNGAAAEPKKFFERVELKAGDTKKFENIILKKVEFLVFSGKIQAKISGGVERQFDFSAHYMGGMFPLGTKIEQFGPVDLVVTALEDTSVHINVQWDASRRSRKR